MGRGLVGEACALMAALTWALALVLFKLSGERVSPLALNLFKSAVGFVLLAGTLLLQGERFDTLRGFADGDIALLLFSGLVGIALADTVFFHALNLIGVGLVSIMDCLYSPFVLLFSWWLLSEQLGWPHYLGMSLIVGAVLISSRHSPPAGRTRGQLGLGMFLGALSMALMAFGIVIVKPVLEQERVPLVWATTLRLAAGTLALSLVALTSARRRACWAVFRPSAAWKQALAGSIMGGYLSMILWVAGFKYTQASIAGVLNQTTVIFAIILAAVILKERLSRRKVIAVTLALCGVVIVTVRP